MQIRFHCPGCDLPIRISRWESIENFSCPQCQHALPDYVDSAAKKELKINHCLVCNSQDLFRQKLFNRNFGIGIVVIGVIISLFVEWKVVPLLAVGLIDLCLYLFLPFMVICYQCDAEFRGFKVDPNLKLYDHLKAAKAKKQPTYPGAEENH